MKIHLVDATYELFRAHFGAPPAKDAGGADVGAVRGLMRSLASLLREPDVTHVACAFDHVIESFRNDLFDGYKTSAGVPPELLAQFPIAEEATKAMGIVTWPMIEFEADDAMATAAARFAEDPRVEEVVLCSPDKDLAQCVSGKRIVLFDRRREQRIDEAGVVEKYGVPPASIPDWLALVGDTADGIPGLPQWGAKSTAAVLSRWGKIEDIPADPDRWEVKVRGAARLSATLEERREDALLYRLLATLRLDAPISESLDELEWKGAHKDALHELCERLRERVLLGRITRWRDDGPPTP